MSLLSLFLTFAQVGILTIGGGLVSIPIVQQYIVDAGYISHEMFYNMIAISESTPGPIGINLATYVGYVQHGIPGALAATLGVCVPGFLIVCLISLIFTRIAGYAGVQRVMTDMRAVAYGLIAAACASVLYITLYKPGVEVLPVVLFVVLTALNLKFNWNVLVFIGVGALGGLLL